MASHIGGLPFSGAAPRLTTRLHQALVRLATSVKVRDEVKASVPLARGERILAWTCDSRGHRVAATERGLYHELIDRSVAGIRRRWGRVGWEEISRVTWNDSEHTLTFTGLFPTVARRTVLHLPEGVSLGLLAQERVAWTAVVRTEIDVGEYGRARVIGRRRPGSDELVWLVGLDGGSDAADLQVALEKALSALRARLGV